MFYYNMLKFVFIIPIVLRDGKVEFNFPKYGELNAPGLFP